MQRVREALAVALGIGEAVILWGAAGIGKTSAIQGLAKAAAWNFQEFIGAIHDPSDITGIPFPENGATAYLPPRWAKELSESTTPSVLFLDELSTATPTMQNAMLKLVMERKAGDLQLPETVRIVAAANPPSQGYATWSLTAPMANRLVHLDWPIELETWSAGMLAGSWDSSLAVVVPSNWEEHLPRQRAEVVSFLKCQPALLHAEPKEAVNQGKAWPSPRSWDKAARLLAAAQAAEVEQEVKFVLVAGTVGEAAAVVYFQWLATLDLPDPEQLLKEPLTTPLAQSEVSLLVTLNILQSVIAKENTASRWSAAWEVAGRVHDEHPEAKDVAASLVFFLANNKPSGQCAVPTAQLLKFEELLRKGGILQCKATAA